MSSIVPSEKKTPKRIIKYSDLIMNDFIAHQKTTLKPADLLRHKNRTWESFRIPHTKHTCSTFSEQQNCRMAEFHLIYL